MCQVDSVKQWLQTQQRDGAIDIGLVYPFYSSYLKTIRDDRRFHVAKTMQRLMQSWM